LRNLTPQSTAWYPTSQGTPKLPTAKHVPQTHPFSIVPACTPSHSSHSRNSWFPSLKNRTPTQSNHHHSAKRPQADS
jgi:hypothetical protein